MVTLTIADMLRCWCAGGGRAEMLRLGHAAVLCCRQAPFRSMFVYVYCYLLVVAVSRLHILVCGHMICAVLTYCYVGVLVWHIEKAHAFEGSIAWQRHDTCW